MALKTKKSNKTLEKRLKNIKIKPYKEMFIKNKNSEKVTATFSKIANMKKNKI